MSSKADKPHNDDQTIEQLKERYVALNERKITAAANLSTYSTHLANLKQQAREKYGTDDIAVLREMLDQLTAENETKRRTYQKGLDEIEADLRAVEQKFATVESSTAEESKS